MAAEAPVLTKSKGSEWGAVQSPELRFGTGAVGGGGALSFPGVGCSSPGSAGVCLVGLSPGGRAS